jgi:hypothetical protein
VGFHGGSEKQVPPLRVAIGKTNRNAPVGMTEFICAIAKANRSYSAEMTEFVLRSIPHCDATLGTAADLTSGKYLACALPLWDRNGRQLIV